MNVSSFCSIRNTHHHNTQQFFSEKLIYISVMESQKQHTHIYITIKQSEARIYDRTCTIRSKPYKNNIFFFDILVAVLHNAKMILQLIKSHDDRRLPRIFHKTYQSSERGRERRKKGSDVSQRQSLHPLLDGQEEIHY